MTGKKKLEADILFATLDSAVGKMYDRDHNREILISDTIGFIKKLPPDLVDAFKSTLMESIHADVLLHVIDAADPKMDEKILVVEQILNDLGLKDKKKIYVFNKVDQLEKEKLKEIEEKYTQFTPHFISVHTGIGIVPLYRSITAFPFL